ncbi:MAG: ECF transporter S component [Acetobacteraceae bacterium]|nr:ECF transporter S component [Acetobacteraceae bacterium]
MNARKLTTTAILAGLSLLLEVTVHFPVLPAAPFLLYSPGDLPIVMGSFALGPGVGAVLALITASLFVLITGKGGPWGGLMHFIAASAFVCVAGLIYRRRPSWGGAVLGLACGIIARAAVMVPANLIVTPIYLGVPRAVVVPMILPTIVPFNLLHSGINSVLFLPLYRALGGFLKKWHRPEAG